MKRTVIAVVTAAAGIASLIGIQAAVGASPPTPVQGPPAAEDASVPTLAPDLGVGERLLLVVEGVYPTREEAEAAEAAFHFGETPVTLSLPVPHGEWNRLVDSADPRWEGSGSAVPGTFRSNGETTLVLSPRSFALFSRS